MVQRGGTGAAGLSTNLLRRVFGPKNTAKVITEGARTDGFSHRRHRLRIRRVRLPYLFSYSYSYIPKYMSEGDPHHKRTPSGRYDEQRYSERVLNTGYMSARFNVTPIYAFLHPCGPVLLQLAVLCLRGAHRITQNLLNGCASSPTGRDAMLPESQRFIDNDHTSKLVSKLLLSKRFLSYDRALFKPLRTAKQQRSQRCPETHGLHCSISHNCSTACQHIFISLTIMTI